MTAPTCPDCGCAARETPLGFLCDVCHAHVSTSPPKARARDDGDHPVAESVAVVVTLADVQPEQVCWLWHRRIPLGKLTLLAGPPGAGKSFAALDLAARVSRGALLPDGEQAPQGEIVILTAEDGLGDTVRPRLDLLGADNLLIHAITMVRRGDDERMFSLEEDIHVLETTILDHQAILAIVDPILAYTGRADTYKESSVRSVLAPLAAMAERTGCAVLAVLHLNKRGNEQAPMNRITSSGAFVAQARSVLLLAPDPSDESGQRRILAPVKMNLCAHPPSLAFHFTQDGGLLWDGATAITAADLLVLPLSKVEQSAQVEAQEFLRGLLADGPVPWKEVEKEYGKAGIAYRTLERAKVALGVKSGRHGFGPGSYVAWELPYTAIDRQNPSTVKMAVYDDVVSNPPLSDGGLCETSTALDPIHRHPANTENSAVYGEPMKERSPLVRLAVDLGAKAVEP